jgi:hypothetical protein
MALKQRDGSSLPGRQHASSQGVPGAIEQLDPALDLLSPGGRISSWGYIVKLRAWHLAICAIGGAIATLSCQWLLAGPAQRYGPFDRYIVAAVVKDPTKPAFAALVDYHHGNSSSDVRAIWLGEGTPPVVGSTEPLQGWPSVVSTAQISPDQVGFGPDHRMILSVRAPAEISSDDGPCYFDEAETKAAPICLDGPGARVVVTP